MSHGGSRVGARWIVDRDCLPLARSKLELNELSSGTLITSCAACVHVGVSTGSRNVEPSARSPVRCAW